MADVIPDLLARELVAQSTDLTALRAELADGPVTAYAGFDATGPSLHAGHLVQMLVLRRLQLGGHRPIVLAGGATGMIGDPGGRSTERVLLTPELVQENVVALRPQLERFVEMGGGPTGGQLVNNLEWTAGLSTIDFLRDVGKHFPVNQMLARDTVATRLAGDGLSYTEFSYMLLQSLDYLELHRAYGCRLQIGGSDQWGNIISGVDLVRRVERHTVHALTTPLLTSSAGEKLGKSTGGGRLWLDPALTSPYSFYQQWLNVEDALVGSLLRRLTLLDLDEVTALEQETRERPQARAGQRALARSLTTIVHGAEEVTRAEQAAAALFGQGELAALPEDVLAAALAEAGVVQVTVGGAVGSGLPPLAELLRLTGLTESTSAARRLVAEGGVSVSNVRATDALAPPDASALLHGRWLVLRRGRRAVAGVRVVSGERGAQPLA